MQNIISILQILLTATDINNRFYSEVCLRLLEWCTTCTLLTTDLRPHLFSMMSENNFTIRRK